MTPVPMFALPAVTYLSLCAVPRGWLTLGILLTLLIATLSVWHLTDPTDPTSGPKLALLTFTSVSIVAAGLVQVLRIVAFAPTGGRLPYFGLVALVFALVVFLIHNLFGA